MNRDTSRHTIQKSGRNGKRDGGRMASESGHKMILIRSMMRSWVMAMKGLVVTVITWVVRTVGV